MSIKMKLTNGIYSLEGSHMIESDSSGADLTRLNYDSTFKNEGALTVFQASCAYYNTSSGIWIGVQSAKEMFANCGELSIVITNLNELKDATSMFENCKLLAIFQPITGLPNLTNATAMFKGCTSMHTWSKMTYWSPDQNEWKLSIADEMFRGCTHLDDFYYDESWPANYRQTHFTKLNNDGVGIGALSSARGMFADTTELRRFNARLTSFTSPTEANPAYWIGPTDVTEIFMNSGIHHFQSGLNAAVTADRAFMNCKNLKTFDSFMDLTPAGMAGAKFGGMNACTSAISMFEGCTSLDEVALTEFNMLGEIGVPWRALKNANNMFRGSALQRIVNDSQQTLKLPSLTNAQNMFSGCKLTLQSLRALAGLDIQTGEYVDRDNPENYGIRNIAQDVNDGSEGFGEITIGMESSLQISPDMQAAIDIIRGRGWKDTLQYN